MGECTPGGSTAADRRRWPQDADESLSRDRFGPRRRGRRRGKLRAFDARSSRGGAISSSLTCVSYAQQPSRSRHGAYQAMLRRGAGRSIAAPHGLSRGTAARAITADSDRSRETKIDSWERRSREIFWKNLMVYLRRVRQFVLCPGAEIFWAKNLARHDFVPCEHTGHFWSPRPFNRIRDRSACAEALSNALTGRFNRDDKSHADGLGDARRYSVVFRDSRKTVELIGISALMAVAWR